MKLNIIQNLAGQRGGAGTKQAEGLANLKLLPQKALSHPTNSKIFKVRCGWEHPPSVPRAVDFSHWTVQTWTKRMCKYTHTTLASKYSQTLMTSRFSLIVVFLNPWFSCGGGLRTIGDLGGWRGAKDNCGLGIFASWTMRSIFGSQFSFFFFFLPLPVLLADPVFWLTGICKCPVSPTADLDCAGVSFPETERANATGSSNLICQEACLFTNCTHQLGFLLNFEGPVLLLFTPTQL